MSLGTVGNEDKQATLLQNQALYFVNKLGQRIWGQKEGGSCPLSPWGGEVSPWASLGRLLLTCGQVCPCCPVVLLEGLAPLGEVGAWACPGRSWGVASGWGGRFGGLLPLKVLDQALAALRTARVF